MNLLKAPRSTRIASCTLIWAAAAFAACGESSTSVEPREPAHRLEGTWQWVSSQDLSSDVLHTPESTGDNASLTFEASSSQGGAFLYSVTGSDDVHGDFVIGNEDAGGPEFIAIEPGIGFLAGHAWLAVGEDRLILTGFTSPRFLSTYVRSKY